MINEVKPLVVRDDKTGIEYTLEFNRESVRFAENHGFVLDEVSKYPMTRVYELWYYAFRMHHKSVSREKTDALLDELGGVKDTPAAVFERLGALYTEGFNTLGGENPTVTVTL